MAMTNKKTFINNATRDPAAFFDSPKAVLGDDDLSENEKLLILRKWELDARALEVATEEAMTGGEASHLEEVLKAIRDLGGKAQGSDSPTKI